MAFASGTRLGPYENVSNLWAGGMGEVHKARDIAWSTNRDGQRAILQERADGSSPEEVLWSVPTVELNTLRDTRS